MDWLNWPGWHWVAIAIALAQGTWFGWAIRSTNAKYDRFSLERDIADAKAKAAPAWRIIEALARSKDPRTCPSIDDELEAFNQFVLEAKDLVGDLAEPEPKFSWGAE